MPMVWAVPYELGNFILERFSASKRNVDHFVMNWIRLVLSDAKEFPFDEIVLAF